MLTIKLSSTNYLLWKNQLLPLLAYLNLTGHLDGSIPSPPPTITADNSTSPNPAYLKWLTSDRRALILIQSSLSEEAMAETLGHQTSREVWRALETAYSHNSVERMHTLRDSLRFLQKGSSTVVDFGRKFKAICDQLSAIGHPLDETDKIHWFLCGLGSSFETFSTTQRLMRPRPSFRDLLSQAESRGGSSNRGRSSNRGGSSRGRGRGRRLPHCQLCRKDGHYANLCPDLHTFARRPPALDANLAQAFQAQCHVSDSSPDWFVDSGASAHMTPSSSILDSASNYSGNDHVLFGNGKASPISHVGTTSISPNIALLDVLVVPQITKSLLSISKLTTDNPVDVLFSDDVFIIQNRLSKEPLARGRRKNGLYVLEQGQHAFLVNLTSKRLRASYDLWHSRLGHVSFDTISLLNKLGCLSVTSIFPNPNICSSCQLSKSKRLPFDLNLKRSAHVLDLVHCDLWGPSPVVSTDGYRYYVIFVDDYSRFTWFYPLKLKSDFYGVLNTFVTFVQTQFACKLKVFQSDGGTEFVNDRVRNLFLANGTHRRLSCPYTPQQNGRVERKHRHITETGLAMMFNAHVPASLWTYAFSSATYIINRLPTRILDNKSPYELLFSTTPNYGNFRVFGSCVFPYLRDYSSHKLAPRSAPCVFVGYSTQYKGYRCLDLSTWRLYTTCHAQFDESFFSFSGSSSTLSPAQLVFSTFSDGTCFSPPLDPPAVSAQPSPPRTPCGLCPDSTSSQRSENVENISMPPATSADAPATTTTQAAPDTMTSTTGYPMQTRSKAGIFKPRHRADLSYVLSSPLHQALFASTEPKGFKSAAKNPKWYATMCDEE